MKQSHAILYLLVTLGALGIDLHLPALMDIKDEFHIDNHAAQLSVLIFVFATGCGQLFTGILSTIISKRAVGFLSCFLFIGASLTITLIDNYTVILMMRALQGVGASGMGVISYAAVNENFDGERAAVIFSIQSGFMNTLPALAPLCGTLLIALGSWRMIFVVFTLYGIGVLIMLYKTYHYKEYPREAVSMFAIMRSFANRHFILYALVCSYGLGFIMTYVSVAPVMMLEVFGYTTLMFSVCFGLNAAVICCVSFSLKKLIPCFGSYRCTCFGLMLLTLASVGLYMNSASITMGTFWLFVVIGSVGFACSMGPAIAIALADYKAHSGIASGCLGCIYLILSSVSGFVITNSDSAGTYVFGASFALGGIALLLSQVMIDGQNLRKHRA